MLALDNFFKNYLKYANQISNLNVNPISLFMDSLSLTPCFTIVF
jgi:hypothetical protein